MDKLQIISDSSESFSGRIEAGILMAAELQRFCNKETVVLGIPRGGVIIANQIAQSLNADMDIVLSHKLGAPANPELAIGAICEDGTVFVNNDLAQYVGADEHYIEREKNRQLQEIDRKVQLYRKIIPKISLAHRLVIVTDDGVATGATMQAALWAVRQENPREIIMALPVGPKHTVTELSQAADETVCLKTPPVFGSLGQFYVNFSQVEDAELLEILKQTSKRKIQSEN
jgi:predicted phosphoribosyltransferase